MANVAQSKKNCQTANGYGPYFIQSDKQKIISLPFQLMQHNYENQCIILILLSPNYYNAMAQTFVNTHLKGVNMVVHDIAWQNSVLGGQEIVFKGFCISKSIIGINYRGLQGISRLLKLIDSWFGIMPRHIAEDMNMSKNTDLKSRHSPSKLN